MKSKATKTKTRPTKAIVSRTRQVMREPILRALLRGSNLTAAQLETLLIDLVVEDSYGTHIRYDEKASLRSTETGASAGVSRGAFNRTLRQARKNVTECLCTMLLLAYLGLFDFTIFRPFEETAGKIGDYRHIRDVLAGKINLSNEDLESYKIAEKAVIAALERLASPMSLKSELSHEKKS
jgi:predicted DNA-binding protein (UPF0251 family)